MSAHDETRRDELDPLLEHDVTDTPPDLAERVLRGLEPERVEARLDRLLDLAGPVETPPDLAERVLGGIAAAREHALPARPRLVRTRRALLAVAAVLALLLLARRFAGPEHGSPGSPEESAQVDPELLACLDLLENWELVTDDELELALAELDEVDTALFESARDLELELSWEDDDGDEG